MVAIPIDSLQFPSRISLAKIDVEGHELAALKGMQNLVKRDHPVLIVEGQAEPVSEYLRALGYGTRRRPALRIECSLLVGVLCEWTRTPDENHT